MPKGKHPSWERLDDLRELLSDTMQDLDSGKITPERAEAATKGVREELVAIQREMAKGIKLWYAVSAREETVRAKIAPRARKA